MYGSSLILSSLGNVFVLFSKKMKFELPEIKEAAFHSRMKDLSSYDFGRAVRSCRMREPGRQARVCSPQHTQSILHSSEKPRPYLWHGQRWRFIQQCKKPAK